MKLARRLLDKWKPSVAEGGKLHWLHSTFDAFETFAFVPNRTSQSGTHIHDVIDLKRTMIVVVAALLPALLFGIYNVGYQHFLSLGALAATGFWQIAGYGLAKVLPTVAVSYVSGLAVEFAVAQRRGHQVNEGFLVTGMLIPLVLPPDIPLWMVAVATVFSVVFAKEVMGGTGMNIFNPAIVARVFLFFAYPAQMSGDAVWVAGLTDGRTCATPLALAAAGEPQTEGIWHNFVGLVPGSVGETSVAAIALGALLLLVTGVASWRIMAAALGGGALAGLLFNLTATGGNPLMDIPFWQHLIMGGFAFGVVFMATDPVSAAHTRTGKWIYGFLVGFLAILLRVLNPAYPEGMMLAILFMNVFASLIDHCVIQANISRRANYAKRRAARAGSGIGQ